MARCHLISPLLIALCVCCGSEALKLSPLPCTQRPAAGVILPHSLRRIRRGGAGASAAEADNPDDPIAFVNISVDEAKEIVAKDEGANHSNKATGSDQTQPAGINSRVKDAMNFMRSAPIERLKQMKDTVSVDALKAKTSAISAKALVLNSILLFGSPTRPLTPLSVITLSLLGSSLGFKSYLWFATVGYTVSLGLVALVALVSYNIMPSNKIPKLSNLQTFMVLIWSIRLTAFLLYREYVAWPSLHAKTKRVNEESHDETKLGVWLTCGAFYAAMTAPCCYRLQAAVDGDKSEWGLVGKFGIFMQFVGLLVESVADAQKATFKATEGNRANWCNVGLWKFFSHPNYLGETIFWLGVYLGGLGSYSASYQYLISTIGLVFIACVLKTATDALSAQELRRYGMNEDYLEFRRMRGFLGPFKRVQQPEKQILL